jgi:hypothetical protein
MILGLTSSSALAVGSRDAAVPDPAMLRLADELLAAGPESAVAAVYETYEATGGRSGHALRLRLSDFETVPWTEFTRHRWLDLMTPPSGAHVAQVRRYLEAPWIEGEQVVYELSWRLHDERAEAKTFRILDELKDDTIRDVVGHLRRVGQMDDAPVAITTYRVRVTLDGSSRTYRAAGFWFPGRDGEGFDLHVQDHVVPEVVSAMVESAEVTTRERWERLRDARLSVAPRALGKSLTQECHTSNQRVEHVPLENINGQGHSAGYHIGVLQMRAQCIADSGCSVQCQPTITLQGCEESSNADLPTFCDHYPKFDSRVSGGSAYNDSASCGAAVACGVKECCGIFCRATGGISLSFSGSAGGLTANATASGGDRVYNLSLDDSIECPPPTKKNDPCAGTAASTVAGRAADAIFIPCDDGGGDGDGETDDGASNDDAGDGTPILLDFGGRGFELTDLAGGVAFDLDADGTAERLSWTEAGADDAFLVLDRDGDGAIDDGSELFGDATPQPPSDEPHGYRALAVFDDDGDGRITAADAVFADLEVWWDRDHDGIADAGERESLAAAGVAAIELDHVVSMRRDRHGNLIRYASRFHVADPQGRPHYPAADVIFLKSAP